METFGHSYTVVASRAGLAERASEGQKPTCPWRLWRACLRNPPRPTANAQIPRQCPSVCALTRVGAANANTNGGTAGVCAFAGGSLGPAARLPDLVEALAQQRLRLVGLIEALADGGIRHQLLGGEVPRALVRVVIVAITPGRRTQMARGGLGAFLDHPFAGRAHGPFGGVRFRRQRQVDRRLGQGE